MKCSASVVSVRGKVATGGEGVESVLQALQCTVLQVRVLRVCFECVWRVSRVCFKRQEASQALLTSSCSSINDPSRILQFLSDQSFSNYGVPQLGAYQGSQALLPDQWSFSFSVINVSSSKGSQDQWSLTRNLNFSVVSSNLRIWSISCCLGKPSSAKSDVFYTL